MLPFHATKQEKRKWLCPQRWIYLDKSIWRTLHVASGSSPVKLKGCKTQCQPSFLSLWDCQLWWFWSLLLLLKLFLTLVSERQGQVLNVKWYYFSPLFLPNPPVQSLYKDLHSFSLFDWFHAFLQSWNLYLASTYGQGDRMCDGSPMPHRSESVRKKRTILKTNPEENRQESDTRVAHLKIDQKRII